MLKLLIFDFDGTLVDTLTDVGIIFNEVLAEEGFPTHPVRRYEHFVGGNLEQVVSRMLPEDSQNPAAIDRVKEAYRKRYAASSKPNTLPYPGMVEVLHALQRAGVGLAINTNKAQELVEPMALRYFPDVSFLGIMGYQPEFPAKPSPAAALQLMERAGVTAAEAAYVGDGETDILTALAAGLPILLASWGQGVGISGEDERLALAARRPEDLLAYVKERNGGS